MDLNFVREGRGGDPQLVIDSLRTRYGLNAVDGTTGDGVSRSSGGMSRVQTSLIVGADIQKAVSMIMEKDQEWLKKRYELDMINKQVNEIQARMKEEVMKKKKKKKKTGKKGDGADEEEKGVDKGEVDPELAALSFDDLMLRKKELNHLQKVSKQEMQEIESARDRIVSFFPSVLDANGRDLMEPVKYHKWGHSAKSGNHVASLHSQNNSQDSSEKQQGHKRSLLGLGYCNDLANIYKKESGRDLFKMKLVESNTSSFSRNYNGKTKDKKSKKSQEHYIQKIVSCGGFETLCRAIEGFAFRFLNGSSEDCEKEEDSFGESEAEIQDDSSGQRAWLPLGQSEWTVKKGEFVVSALIEKERHYLACRGRGLFVCDANGEKKNLIGEREMNEEGKPDYCFVDFPHFVLSGLKNERLWKGKRYCAVSRHIEGFKVFSSKFVRPSLDERREGSGPEQLSLSTNSNKKRKLNNKGCQGNAINHGSGNSSAYVRIGSNRRVEMLSVYLPSLAHHKWDYSEYKALMDVVKRFYESLNIGFMLEEISDDRMGFTCSRGFNVALHLPLSKCYLDDRTLVCSPFGSYENDFISRILEIRAGSTSLFEPEKKYCHTVSGCLCNVEEVALSLLEHCFIGLDAQGKATFEAFPKCLRLPENFNVFA
eukprot:Nk52_evm71s212 gene=Nk52_evmTU71s212